MIKFLDIYKNNIDLTSYYNNQNNIGSPFIISLDSQKNKFINTRNILTRLGLNPIRFPAINGQSIINLEISKKFSNLSPGEIGCFLSHMSIYNIASSHQNKSQYTPVFEDDILANIPNKNILNKRLNNLLKYDADLIYLGKCTETCHKLIKLEPNIYIGHQPHCFHAYLIKNSYASMLLNIINNILVINIPVDLLILNIINKNNLLVCHPSLFIQDFRTASSLRSKYKQFFNSWDCSLESYLITGFPQNFWDNLNIIISREKFGNNNNYNIYLLIILIIIIILVILGIKKFGL